MKNQLKQWMQVTLVAVLVVSWAHSVKADQSLHDRLAHGEIVTNGDYQPKGGVWAKMVGVVQAPPEVVWDLFLQANKWKTYRIPHLTDSRAVDEQIAKASATIDHAEDIVKALNGRVVDPMTGRKKGGIWVNYTYQYYDLPWPVANKWMVVKTKNDESRATEHRYRGEWTKSGGNVKTVDGYIVIEPFDVPEVALMTYYATSDPGSAVPKFLLKWGLKKSMPATIEAIRREALKISGAAPAILKAQ
jgi:hypothetical protein